MNIQIVKVTANIQVFSRVYGYITGLRTTKIFSVTFFKVVEQNESEDVIELISNNQFQGIYIGQSFSITLKFLLFLNDWITIKSINESVI